MKNHSIIRSVAILLLGVLSACSRGSDGEQPRQAPGKIEFGIAVEHGPETRAGDYYDQGAITGFKLYAFSDDDYRSAPFINGESVTISNGTPVYDKSWPKSSAEKFRFAALAPQYLWSYTSGQDMNLDRVNIPSYTIPNNSMDHVDMLYATTGADYYYNQLVPLYFRHALTRISFAARVSSSFSGRQVEVTKITLANVGNYEAATLTDAFNWETAQIRSDFFIDFWATDRQQLTASYKLLMPEGEDCPEENTRNSMLLFPHSDLTGVEMVVDLSVDGVAEQRTIDLGAVVYTGDPWPMGKHIVYQITVKPKDAEIVASVVDWTDVYIQGILQ